MPGCRESELLKGLKRFGTELQPRTSDTRAGNSTWMDLFTLRSMKSIVGSVTSYRPCLTSIGHGGPTIVSSRSSQLVRASHSSPSRSAGPRALVFFDDEDEFGYAELEPGGLIGETAYFGDLSDAVRCLRSLERSDTNEP